MNRFPVNFCSRLVAVARGQIGVREVGKNGGSSVRAYQSATDLEPGSWPWCAAFVCWCMEAATVSCPHSVPLPHSASARALLEWGNDFAARIPGNPFHLTPGDLVVFKFHSGHHCGIVAGVHEDGEFSSVEGNTNLAGSREGDGVFLRRRDQKFLLGAVSLKF